MIKTLLTLIQWKQKNNKPMNSDYLELIVFFFFQSFNCLNLHPQCTKLTLSQRYKFALWVTQVYSGYIDSAWMSKESRSFAQLISQKIRWNPQTSKIMESCYGITSTSTVMVVPLEVPAMKCVNVDLFSLIALPKFPLIFIAYCSGNFSALTEYTIDVLENFLLKVQIRGWKGKLFGWMQSCKAKLTWMC